MHKESVSCLALHRQRKITSLDCAKVLTNYFRPLETAAGIISLPLPLSPRRLKGDYSKHDWSPQRKKTCPVISYSYTIQIKAVKGLLPTVCIQSSFIFAAVICPADNVMTVRTAIGADSAGDACVRSLSQQCVCMLRAASLPLCNRR